MKVLFKNPFFLIGLFLRIGFLFYHSEGVMKDFFIPFLDFSVKNPLQNPWEHLPAEYFPYGIVLFVIIYIPKLIFYLLFGELSLGAQTLSFVAIKISLLISDLFLVRLLIKITGNRANHILLFYWLNPIAIYISFIHGQLDLVPMLLALSGIYYAGINQIVKSSILIALAVLSKFHTIIVLPLILFYFWNNQFINKSLPKIFKWTAIFIVLLIIGLLPVYLGQKLEYNSLGSPEAFRIFSLNFSFNNHITIYFGVMIVLFILGRLLLSTRMTAEGLFYGSSLLFGSLLVVTHSMPGWYFWILPYIAVFFATYNFAPRLLMVLMSVFYFFSMTTLLKIFPISENLYNLALGINFSLLQLTIITILVFIFMMSIRFQAPFERRLRPLTIGIAGNSGAGKNLLSSSLMKLFGPTTTQVIEGDDYHKWERGNIKWQEYTHLHPRANNLSHLKEHLNQLSHGKLIFQRHYDHSTGKFTEPRPLQPTKTLIVQGLHSLYLKSLRNDFDLKIYISPDDSLRTAWKIKRDCGERGHSLEKVLQSIKTREKDTQLYVQPQREEADLVVEYSPVSEINLEKVLDQPEVPYKMKLILWNDSSLEDLIENLMNVPSLKVKVLDDQDINRVSIELDGSISAVKIQSIADKTIPHQRSITRSRREPKYENNYLGLIQLFIFKTLSERV